MQWINIKDQLPLSQDNVHQYATVAVIVCDQKNNVSVMDFAMGNTVNPWHQFGDCIDGWITHWMPLPAPPTEE